MRLVEIEWEDVFNGNHSWTKHSKEFDDSPMIVKTVGYVLFESDKRLRVAMSYSHGEDDTIHSCDWFTIPKPCVIQVRELVPA